MRREAVERIEGTTDTKALKTLQEALSAIAFDMKSESFEQEDFVDYINQKASEMGRSVFNR